MSITINDIAKQCNVSKSTVSRYLNGGSVSKKTAEKIQNLITETGYESNLFASSLKRKQTKMIGVIFKGIQSVTVSKLLSEINMLLKAAGYYPLITIVENDNVLNDEIEHILTLAKQGVEGIILGTDKITVNHLEVIKKINIPVLLVGQESDEVPYRKVDNYQAGKMIGEYINKMNHKKIVFLGLGNEDREVGFYRRQGFQEYFSQNEIKDATVSFVECGYTFEDGYRNGQSVLANDPTVVICSTDRIAMGFIQYLNEHKISIPDQISVIGFGDYDFSKVVHPALTTVRFDYSKLSQLAVVDIMNLIHHEKVEKTGDIEAQLICRSSVKKLN